MPDRELLIDGRPLGNDAVGIGAYGARLVRGLLDRRAELRLTPVVAAPSDRAARLGFGANVRALAAPRIGHPLLDQAAWSLRLGLHACRRRAVLFSPAPFWSPVAPADSVVCQHDRIYHHFPRYLGRKFVRRFLAYRAEAFLRRCRFIVTESDYARDDLAHIRGVAAASIRVIPAWLPDGFTAEAARAQADRVRTKYHLPARFWLYLGGYDYRKNVELLVAAYARTARIPGTPRLVLAGRIPRAESGPYCDMEAALRQADLPADAVVRTGFIEGADLAGLYGAAELFVFPSRSEGFGLPPMEAMGCGCPAICADNSSLREVVRDDTYRFPDNDPAPLAGLLARAAERPFPLNPSFDRMQFDEHAAISAYIDLFNRIATS